VHVEYEMIRNTCNHWGHWNCNHRTKKVSKTDTREAFSRFPTKNSCTGDVTHNRESATVWKL